MKHFQPSIPVDTAIRSRRSIRAFIGTPLASQTVAELLALAARAPSGTNMQPWRAYVIGRPKIDEISSAIRATGVSPTKASWDDYRYYPQEFPEPYLSRRRQVGAALYARLGIQRREVTKMRRHFERNFTFFGAPTGIILTIDRRLEQGSWLDLGMFIQTLLIAAQARGIGTCVQAAFAPYHHQIRPIIGMDASEVLVCGVALGYPDEDRAENGLRTERAPLHDWVVDLAGHLPDRAHAKHGETEPRP